MVDNALVYCTYCKHNVLGKRTDAREPYRCVVCKQSDTTIPPMRELPRRKRIKPRPSR